jgi:MSHA biogenesis protein MshP
MKKMQNKFKTIRQRGFSIVSAIFLLVVIAALGVFAVTLSTTQHQSMAMDIMGKRAYQAARAGIEWGAYQIIQNSAVAGGFALNCQGGGVASQVSNLVAPLDVFNPVNVSCTAVSAVDATNVWVYSLSASAVTGGAPGDQNYVAREIRVTLAPE